MDSSAAFNATAVFSADSFKFPALNLKSRLTSAAASALNCFNRTKVSSTDSAFGSLERVSALPESLTHSIAVVERWLKAHVGVYRVQFTSETKELVKEVESHYDHSTGMSLLSAPAFDVESDAVKSRAGAYSRVAKSAFLNLAEPAISVSAARALVKAHEAGAWTPAMAAKFRKHVLDQDSVTPAQRAMLVVLFEHLHRVAQHSAMTGMTGVNLLRMWAMPLLMPTGIELKMADQKYLYDNISAFAAALGPVVDEWAGTCDGLWTRLGVPVWASSVCLRIDTLCFQKVPNSVACIVSSYIYLSMNA